MFTHFAYLDDDCPMQSGPIEQATMWGWSYDLLSPQAKRYLASQRQVLRSASGRSVHPQGQPHR